MGWGGGGQGGVGWGWAEVGGGASDTTVPNARHSHKKTVV